MINVLYYCNWLRYEWSVGESDFDDPIGVFDKIKDKVWHEIGHGNDIVFTVDRGITAD
jgi:hypothetical protein